MVSADASAGLPALATLEAAGLTRGADHMDDNEQRCWSFTAPHSHSTHLENSFSLSICSCSAMMERAAANSWLAVRN